MHTIKQDYDRQSLSLIYSKNAELVFKICIEQENKSISLLNLFENNSLKRFDRSEISRCVTIWYSGSFNFDAVLFLFYFFEQKEVGYRDYFTEPAVP